jgi:anti-anti-sigma regulatory factor
MLRISRVAGPTNATVLRLEGQIVGAWVDELKQACEDCRSADHDRSPLILDLREVSFLDAEAIALLRQLVTGGASLTNYSVFLAEQLKEVADVDR